MIAYTRLARPYRQEAGDSYLLTMEVFYVPRCDRVPEPIRRMAATDETHVPTNGTGVHRQAERPLPGDSVSCDPIQPRDPQQPTDGDAPPVDYDLPWAVYVPPRVEPVITYVRVPGVGIGRLRGERRTLSGVEYHRIAITEQMTVWRQRDQFAPCAQPQGVAPVFNEAREYKKPKTK